MGSAAMAMVDREEELFQALDSKAAKVALQAINNEYNVNWGELDFKNHEDDLRATKVQGYLDVVLGRKSAKWYNKSANLRRETGDYVHPLCLQYDARGREYYSMQSTLSDSWSRAFSESLGPQDEVSSASSSTSSEMQLDERETKAVLWAITHKFAVTDPADRDSTSKVNQYLRAVLERKQQTSPKHKGYSTQWSNLDKIGS